MRQYISRSEQAHQLAKLVAKQLTLAISSYGKVALIVAGGSTPKLFMESLSNLTLDWSEVSVIPSDERWVDSNHPRSNDRFIRENLITNKASCARVVSLYIEAEKPEDVLSELESKLEDHAAYPSVCVLGMGADAHFASLFPGANNLNMGLDPQTNSGLVTIQAPGADEARVSLTLARILRSEAIHLLISGKEKLATLQKAKQPGHVEQMPIRALLNNSIVEIHYAD